MKVVFEITGLSCDLALHPISPQTAESMREGGRDIYSQKYMNWWRRGNTRTFGMRLNESSEIRLQVDGEDVSFNANLLYRNVYTLRQRMYLSSKALTTRPARSAGFGKTSTISMRPSSTLS